MPEKINNTDAPLAWKDYKVAPNIEKPREKGVNRAEEITGLRIYWISAWTHSP